MPRVDQRLKTLWNVPALSDRGIHRVICGCALANISKDVKVARPVTPDLNLGKKPLAKLNVQLLSQEAKIKALEESRATDFKEQEALFQQQTDTLSELVLSIAKRQNAHDLND